MTLPSQSQFDSALTKTDLAEIFQCRKIRTTGALLRIRSSREAAAARQPDRMGTTSFSTASTSSIAPGSVSNQVLMLYFYSNLVGTPLRLRTQVRLLAQ